MPTAVSGNITDLSTANVIAGSFIRFQLRGTGGNQPRVSGTTLIAQGVGTGQGYFFDFNPDASGNISGTLYSTRDATGLLGGEIEVGGSTTSVWYEMSLWRNGKKLSSIHCHAKNGVTLNLSNVTPISVNPAAVAPTGDTTYARLAQDNFTNYNTVAFSATPVFSGAGCFLICIFEITLTGNVTSSTLTNIPKGTIIIFKIIENSAGAWTFAFPANIRNPQSIDTTANAINVQAFFYDGTNANAIGPGV